MLRALTFPRANARATKRMLSTQPLAAPGVAPLSVPQQVFSEVNSYWKRWVLMRAGLYITVGVGVAYTLNSESEYGVVCRMTGKFSKSTVESWDERDAEAKIVRTKVIEPLKQLLRPQAVTTYAVVVGASGTGKSTAVRKAIRELQGEKGVVYFASPPECVKFSLELSAVLGYAPPRSIWNRFSASLYGFQLQNSTDPDFAHEPLATWLLIKPLLLKAADNFRARHQRPAVLVLDAMDRVAKQNPALFSLIQEFAKDCADKGDLQVVLVFSDGTALPLLNSQSSKSRARNPVEVGDIDDSDAISYLESKYKVPKADATSLVEQVAGGRLALLNQVGESKKPAARVQHELHVETDDALHQLGISPTQALFKRLLPPIGQELAVDMNEAHTLLPAAKAKELLRLNIISQHPNNTYTFHSRHVEAYFRGKLAMPWWLW